MAFWYKSNRFRSRGPYLDSPITTKSHCMRTVSTLAVCSAEQLSAGISHHASVNAGWPQLVGTSTISTTSIMHGTFAGLLQGLATCLPTRRPYSVDADCTRLCPSWERSRDMAGHDQACSSATAAYPGGIRTPRCKLPDTLCIGKTCRRWQAKQSIPRRRRRKRAVRRQPSGCLLLGPDLLRGFQCRAGFPKIISAVFTRLAQHGLSLIGSTTMSPRDALTGRTAQRNAAWSVAHPGARMSDHLGEGEPAAHGPGAPRQGRPLHCRSRHNDCCHMPFRRRSPRQPAPTATRRSMGTS